MDTMSSTIDTLQTTPLTAAQLEIVRQVHKDTGILTVRDRATSPTSNARPYGQSWNPTEPMLTGGTRVSASTRKVRMVERMFAGSMVFPDGLPVGVTRIFKQSQPGDMGPDKEFKFVHAKYDMTYPQMKRVKSYAYGKRWMTDEERDADERRKSLLRAKRSEDELDPVTAQASAISDMIGESIAKALGKVGAAAAQGVTPPTDDAPIKMRWVEQVIKMRWVEQESGKKRRRYFIADPDGLEIDGPFKTRDEAEKALAELDE